MQIKVKIAPPFLKKGDAVAILTTARKVSREEMQPAIEFLRTAGLRVLEAPNLYASHHQFGGTDEQRTQDFQWALDHPDVRAILFARGGYGSMRIVDEINFNTFQQNPKWLVGFSDATIWHTHIHRLGYQSIHATMPILFNKEADFYSAQKLIEVLTGNTYAYGIQSNYVINEKLEGILIGGNLTLLHHCIGTCSEPNWRDVLLFVEEVDEYLYHIERMHIHLGRANILASIKAYICGYYTEIKDNTIPFGISYEAIITHCMKKYSVAPLFTGLKVGHAVPNLPLVFGALHEILPGLNQNYTLQLIR